MVSKKEANKIIKELSKEAGIEKGEYRDVSVEEKKNQVDLMLKRSKEPFKCMAVGIHQNHYYFGTILSNGKNKVPAVILDDGTVFVNWNEVHDNEIKDRFGLKYRFELFEDVVDNLWSNKSILDFKNGNYEQPDMREMFERIRNKNKSIIFHQDERAHSFIACDIISNYLYQIFNAKGRTYFPAEFGSGKSKQAAVYQKLSFNSLFASNISAAAFERVIESTGGTLIVDNFDNCNDDLKKAILQCIEVYYKKGGKNIKAAGQGLDKNKPIAFNGYSPLVINNIIGLPEVTESRCNRIPMLKTDNKKIVDVRIKDEDPFWNKTKDDLHILALKKWKQVKEVYDTLEVPELAARDLERAEAVLTIAKCIGEDIYTDLRDYLIENSEQHSIKDVHDDWDFILYEFLNNFLGTDNMKTVKINEITESVAGKIIKNDLNPKADKLKFSHYAGKVLKNTPIFKKKIIAGWVHYEIQRDVLNKILAIKKFDRYLTIPHPTTPNNTNNTNNTLTSKNDNLGDVGDVGCGSKVPLELVKTTTPSKFEELKVEAEKI